MTNCAHLFAFFMPPRDATRPVQPFMLRDYPAAFELLAALGGYGFAFGRTLLNHPPPGPQPVSTEPIPMALDDVHEGDCIVTTTRPPLSDPEHGDIKQVRRGHTWLEDRILRLWAGYFAVLARTHLRLAHRLDTLLPPGFEDRRDIVFRSRRSAAYKRLHPCDGRRFRYVPPGDPRTAAFLLHAPAIWPGGPAYVGIFGMHGLSTLAWAWQLRNVMPELLEKPGFTMVELVAGDVPERPTDLRWMSTWSVEPVLVATP